MDLMELGRVLQERRDAIGTTKAEIARRIGISESYALVVEQGKRRPSKAVLERWANALGWDEVYTRQLLILAGHITQEQNSTPPLPFAAGALHFPQPRRMEKEQLLHELRELLDTLEASDKPWEENIGLLRSFFEWLQFRLGE